MSLLFCDNFSVYGNNKAFMLNGLYAQADFDGLVTDPDGVSGGFVTNATNASTIRFVVPELNETLGMAFRLWMDALPTQDNGAQGHGGLGYQYPAVFLLDGSNNVLLELSVTTTGRLHLRGPVLGTSFDAESTNPVVASNGWFHIELKAVSNGAAGEGGSSFEVRVEGATVAGISLPAGFVLNEVYQVSLSVDAYGSGGGPGTHYKDFVLWNGAGAHNNDFLGSVIVALLNPVADVSLNWTPTPTGSTGASILDNIPPQDGQYLDAPNPPPAAYVGTLSNLSPDTTSVKAIMTMVRAAKTDGGDGNLQVGLISSPDNAPATALGDNRPITVAQTYWTDVFEVDPKTGVAWLPSAVNNAQLRLDRTL